jgi:ketosteroid isomerase-like protein
MTSMKLLLLLLLSICNLHSFSQDAELHRTIAKLDSTFFHAYNTCDIATQEAFYADKIEFFHDRNGLDTSKQNILANTKKYVCGRVTRELVKGSLEVSPLPGYGAVEVGMHLFHNSEEKDAKPKPGRFIIIWNNEHGNWRIAKVISLH